MRRRNVRTYKLRLSSDGIDRFIDCHARVAKSLGEMIPYGMTLFVGLSILADGPTAEWIDVDDERIARRFAGEKTYYVGFSYQIAELASAISASRAADGLTVLPISHLYLLALQCLALIDDTELHAASRQAVEKSLSRNDDGR